MPVQERRRVKGALGALQDVVGGRRLPAAPRVQHRRRRVGLVGAPALPLRRPLGCRETLGPVVGRRRRRTPHAGAAPAAAGCWTAKPYPARSRPYAHTLPQLPGQLKKVLRTPALPGPVTVLSAFSASRRRPARSSKEANMASMPSQLDPGQLCRGRRCGHPQGPARRRRRQHRRGGVGHRVVLHHPGRPRQQFGDIVSASRRASFMEAEHRPERVSSGSRLPERQALSSTITAICSLVRVPITAHED
jgi:hypothetical protein